MPAPEQVRSTRGCAGLRPGDRIGRKRTLVITMSVMGGATVAIELVPD